MSGMPASAPFAVFISHKSQDAEMARRLKAVLSSHAPKVNVFLSEEIPPGDHWHDRIEEALRATHWFLLLYTSSDHNWGWCLYEAGLFDGSCTPGDPDRRRICMHHPDEPPPAQFATRQSSFVDRAGVKDFLKTFFLKAGQVRKRLSTRSRTRSFLCSRRLREICSREIGSGSRYRIGPRCGTVLSGPPSS